MTNEHSSLEKIYLSQLYSKWLRKGCERVMCEMWVRDWRNCKILTPSSFALAALFSRSAWLLNRGSWGAHSPLLGAGSIYSILSPTNWPQLTEPVCGTGLYNCLTPTCFLWASHLHPIQPVHSQGYTLISSTGCTCSLINGWFEGQYVTYSKPVILFHTIYLQSVKWFQVLLCNNDNSI